MTQNPHQMTSDPEWPEQAARYAEGWGALPGCVEVHHIGSTAVPGLPAKPIIDLMPVFRSLDALEAARSAIEALGYDWMGPYGLPHRRYCRLEEDGRRRAHAHAYVVGSPEITRHLAFRDMLRTDRALRAAYAAIKASCARAYSDDAAYAACKSDWIKVAEARALALFGSRGDR